MSVAVALEPGEVWRDRTGRTFTILRIQDGETFYRKGGDLTERWMKSHFFAWQLGRDKATRVSAAPQPTR